jgi:GNAT superfamily N-acetyltransferase
MTGKTLTLEDAGPADAADLAAMMESFAVEDGQEAGLYSPEKILRDAFGPEPAFSAIIARLDGEAVAYALFFPMYNTELGARGLWLFDLWVSATHRGAGIGRRLLAAVASRALSDGRACIWWGVRNANLRARNFYAALGAKDDEARILELDGKALEALAAEAAST